VPPLDWETVCAVHGGPGDLPFERPARYELTVNFEAAKAIGLTLRDSFVLGPTR
jgi:hypothetical protein